MPARSIFTIRATLLGAFAALSVLVIVALGWKATAAWQTYADAKAAQEFDVGTNRFIRGLYAVLLERLAVNNALQAADAAPPAVRQEIEGYRKTERENFDAGLAALERQDFPDKDQLLRELRSSLDAASLVRRQSDAALGQRSAERDAGLVGSFVPTLNRSVDAALNLWFAALHQAAGSDPLLTKLATIKEIGWTMRDMSGRERATLSQAIAGGAPLTPEQLAANAGFRSRVAALWQQLEHLTRDPRTHAEIIRAMAAARDQYFGSFVSLAEELRKASANGAKYPVSAKQYVDTTTPQIGTLLEVLYAAGRASEQRTAEMLSDSFATLLLVAALSVLGLALIGAAAIIVVLRVTRPISFMAMAVQQLAKGDYTVEVPGAGRRDELGHMAKSVEVFKQGMVEAERLRTEQEQMKARAEAEKKQAMNEMADQFETGVKGIVQMVSSASTEMQSTAQSMSATAEEMSRQSTAVAAASEQASTNVQTVASAAEELSSSIGEISRQVAESARIAGQAVTDAERTNAQIKGLAEAAQRIGDVVKLINDIAGQTNLLALNATIEAARAGEAGKGFAVVASEVKSLATQTAKATDEIGIKISEIQAATGKSVEAMQAIGGTIGRISEIATTIASAVEEQGAATKEIARNVQQASAGTHEVSSNIAGVTKAASETGAASSQVLGAAGALAKQSETLRAQVEGFIAKIRAA